MNLYDVKVKVRASERDVSCLQIAQRVQPKFDEVKVAVRMANCHLSIVN